MKPGIRALPAAPGGACHAIVNINRTTARSAFTVGVAHGRPANPQRPHDVWRAMWPEVALCPKGAPWRARCCGLPHQRGRRESKDHENERSNMALKKSELYSSLWSSCDELRGGMDASQYKDIEDGEYPFFVRSTTVEQINSYSYDCEAILIPGEGRIGSIFHYINGRFDVHQRVYAITQFSNSVSGKYVYLYIAEHFGEHAMENSVKATVDSLRLPTFQNFDLALPPTLDEQTAIADILSDMDAEITALEAKLSKARQLKQGMMQELLTGRIRLV